jgi:phospholipid/cholesterol/gamma-HCH transport system permease protein
MAGALLLSQSMEGFKKAGQEVIPQGFQDEQLSLFNLVRAHAQVQTQPEPVTPAPAWEPIQLLGRWTVGQLAMAAGFLSFVGRSALVCLYLLGHPQRIRWRATGYQIENAGFNALPIIGLLTFLIGIVIAYQGGRQLENYGANIFITDLVGLSVTREFGPLITAILVAGRTGSAFAAQISTMKVSEEVDAITVLGLDPIELLVVPKLMAMCLILPLLTLYADVMGILGGMLIAGTVLQVSSHRFLARLPEAVSLTSYLTGLGKAPVFAWIITTVGCYQGLVAEGSAESVGRRTTSSVVQAIFLIIVADAFFSILFSWLGI